MENYIAVCMTNKGMTQGKDAECCTCQAKVWLSDSTVEAVKEKDPEGVVEPICLMCFLANATEEDIDKIQAPTTNQVKDIINNINNDNGSTDINA